MQKALINGLVCYHADPLKIDSTLGAILVCRTNGTLASVAALRALGQAGLVVYNSLTNLASAAPAKLKAHHCTRPGSLWTPRIVQPGEVIDGYAEGEECPQHVEGVGEFFAVVRGCQVWDARYHAAYKSIIWARGDVQSWADALGELVVAHSPVYADDYAPDQDAEDQPPHLRPVLDLDSMG